MVDRIAHYAGGLAVVALAAGCASSRPATVVSSAGPTSCFDQVSEDTTVYDTTQVSEKPIVRDGPVPDYPDALRLAGVQGRVVVVATIAPTGKAEHESMKVIQSVDPGLDQSARRWVSRAT